MKPGGGGRRLQPEDRATRLFPAALTQEKKQAIRIAGLQTEPAAFAETEAGRVARNFQNDDRKGTTGKGRLCQPQRLIQFSRPRIDKPVKCKSMIFKPFGKKLARLAADGRFTHKKHGAPLLRLLPRHHKSGNRQGKPRGSSTVTQAARADFRHAGPDKATAERRIKCFDPKRDPVMVHRRNTDVPRPADSAVRDGFQPVQWLSLHAGDGLAQGQKLPLRQGRFSHDDAPILPCMRGSLQAASPYVHFMFYKFQKPKKESTGFITVLCTTRMRLCSWITNHEPLQKPVHGRLPLEKNFRTAYMMATQGDRMARIDQTEDWRERHAPTISTFESLAIEAYGKLPETFRQLTGNLVIEIADFPTDDVFEDMALETPFDLLGLFEGRGLTERFSMETGEMPNRILLYRRPILDYWAENEETLGDIITHVLIHEIGHHFGLSDEDMERIEASV